MTTNYVADPAQVCAVARQTGQEHCYWYAMRDMDANPYVCADAAGYTGDAPRLAFLDGWFGMVDECKVFRPHMATRLDGSQFAQGGE